ncbi:hypothetical protein MRB53_040320 [Persea americana]|nr:hypothetical protein MRB53_040320 [Persea americana]
MLAKDAMYCALGLAAPSLDKKFDFDNFMLTALVVDLQKSVQHANIIRRRIAILLAKWSPIGILDTNRPLVYQIFSHLLDKSEPANDEAVRITTAKRLRGIVDEWSFDATVFKSYAPDVLTRLFSISN